MNIKKISKTAIAALMSISLLTGCKPSGPTPAEAARNQGIIYMEQGQYTDAVASFEQAFSLCDQKMPETKKDIYLYKAACELKLGSYENLRDTCTIVLGMAEDAQAYYMRGIAFLNLGAAAEAETDFNCAAELAPKDYDMFLAIYREYESRNQSAIGDGFLQKILALPADDIEDMYRRASIYYYLKDYAKASEELAQPVEEKHRDSMALMGQIYLALGDTVHARTVFQQYMDEYGETPQGINGMVLCEIAEGSYGAAIQAAQNGLAMEGEDGKKDLLFNMVVAYEKNLDFETAKEKITEFMELYPGDEAGQREYDFLITR